MYQTVSRCIRLAGGGPYQNVSECIGLSCSRGVVSACIDLYRGGTPRVFNMRSYHIVSQCIEKVNFAVSDTVMTSDTNDCGIRRDVVSAMISDVIDTHMILT